MGKYDSLIGYIQILTGRELDQTEVAVVNLLAEHPQKKLQDIAEIIQNIVDTVVRSVDEVVQAITQVMEGLDTEPQTPQRPARCIGEEQTKAFSQHKGPPKCRNSC